MKHHKRCPLCGGVKPKDVCRKCNGKGCMDCNYTVVAVCKCDTQVK